MARRNRVAVKGLKQVQRNMQKLGRQGVNAFNAALYTEGLNIVADATEKAPAVTGRLRNSHFATLPSRRGKVTIGFGVVYAAAVEYGLKLVNASRRQQRAAFANMRENGWRKSNVGGPGFFRGAIAKARSGMVSRVARRAKTFFRRGIGVTPSSDIPTKYRKR